MENFQLALVGVGILIYLIYKYGTSTYKYFEEKGVPYEKPIAFLGNFTDVILQRSSMGDTLNRIYTKFKYHR